MTRLMKYFEPYILFILLAVMLLFGQAICDLSLPDYMSDIVNKGIANNNSLYIIKTGFKMIGISLVSAIFSVAVGFFAAKVAAGLSQTLRIDLFKKVESFSSAEFDKFSTSSLITRTTNDITQIQTLIVMVIRIVFYAPILGIGGVIHALANSKSMSWIVVLSIVVLLCIILTMFVLVMPKFKIVQSLIDKLNLVVRENLDGMLVIRAFNTQKFEENRFDKANKNLTDTNLFINRVTSGMMPAMMLLMNLVTVLIVWVGAKQVSAFKMDVGEMMAYMQYVMQIIMAFLMMAMMFIMIPRASVSAARIADVLETDPSIKDPISPVNIKASLKGLIEFKNVCFSYPGAEEDVLHDINFIAKPGETTAFIGSTGSGKSSLVNLIPRFYDATKGEVLIDGINVNDLSLYDLRNNLGYVPQKGILFSGTINSNIAYGGKNSTEADILKAAEIAQAMEFIDSKEDRFETSIAQGGNNVSGGQKQRLSIARALVKKPQICIFDDSFSALDFKTDAALRRAIKNETGSSTVLLVAQRISTIMTADQIIVLDKGHIVGKGTHNELMETCEVYKEIALSQLSKEEL
ncbi:ATP-binding cassette subfamily B protein [Clostridium saccharoperbutylacetonicum]|uniref:ABC-type multidrug transport system, ATPase and permease components n=2 Tax=Clostridium TaxID=1485 RepID=M1M016_9CLOT|nr:ABC transporter ATP-binding protein [Clostridium saccharoperbutylacetonicum]AGF58900.1 ABC-type multidrug transport system, ATPase and permease components [Clostridium saccharoperbutylacetonicum N1-4(HMT)]NRT60315.1 ATP-binding cassette subfamily B protein [Clostridium saccharoperbutylacetonicum]NSB23627.1 ATP-binding cassette subfamily B protein [Clostridium saccharoperbutylacetonicum]NSB42998.1 ATP-binding cassette subfamily B protein [Clostridium saccharoperbutylacetonicum]